MILIGLFQLLLLFLENTGAQARICVPAKLDSLDWDEFKWLYKQQDSTFSGDSVAAYVFIRINPDGTRETREVSELHQPWTDLLASEIDSFEVMRDSLIKRIHAPYRLKYTSTTRNKKQQLALQKKGFSKAFISFHNFGLAADGAIARKVGICVAGPFMINMVRKQRRLVCFGVAILWVSQILVTFKPF